MVDHKLFIAWAFNRHCSAPHNADFEVCQDKACVRARGYENAQHSVQRTLFPACVGCEYNPCDLENNWDYCPAPERR